MVLELMTMCSWMRQGTQGAKAHLLHVSLCGPVIRLSNRPTNSSPLILTRHKQVPPSDQEGPLAATAAASSALQAASMPIRITPQPCQTSLPAPRDSTTTGTSAAPSGPDNFF